VYKRQGKEYGSGSSRDWAAKGTALLGVKAVIAESFERIHRSNLVGMGVIPFEFTNGDTRKSLGLTGDEVVSIRGLDADLKPRKIVDATIAYADGTEKTVKLLCRIDTEIEIEYVEHGGVLHYVLRNLAKAA
jgi:aconitate hydratase